MTDAPGTKDYYAVLGVLPTAEHVVITAAYRELAKKYHPDKWKGNLSVAEARMRELNEAYNELSNERRRREYDRDRNATPEYANKFSHDSAGQSQQSAKQATRQEEMKRGVKALGLIIVILVRRVLFAIVAIGFVLVLGLSVFQWATGR